MKAIGIQIKGSDCIICVLRKKDDKFELLKETKKLNLENHIISEEVKNLQKELFMTFDAINADKIGVLVRQHKSRKDQYIPSPISFKIEGLIQLYKKKPIDFIAPQSVSAFLKKNTNLGLEKHKYQKKAVDLAHYLLEND